MRPYVTKAHVYKHTHTHTIQRTTYNELLNKCMSNKQKINIIYTHIIQRTTNC